MRKLGIIAIVFVAGLMIASCGNKSQQVPFDNGDSIEVANADPTLYGVCLEGTAMNTLQLLTDTGDSLSLDLSEAQENGKVFGGLQVGDRMAVVPNADHTAALMVVNQATLLGNWVMPNPIDGSDEVGISIKEGGIAESIDQSNIVYKTWRLTRGKLEFVFMREGGSEEDEACAYDLIALGPDSLVYKLPLNPDDRQNGIVDAREEEEVYHYSRQKPKEQYGREVELEESSSDDFIM